MNSARQEVKHYRTFARWLHWLMALLIVGMVFVGVAMVDSVASWQPTAVKLHKWLGLTLLVLVLVRLIFRLRNPAPALPSELPKLQAFAARGAHVGLYALMFAMPLIGWAMQGAAGTPILLPGGWVLPALMPQDLATYGVLRDLHALFAYALFALVLLHAGAALYHGFVRRDDVLNSMLIGAQKSASNDDLGAVAGIEVPLASESTASDPLLTPSLPAKSTQNTPPG